MAGRTKQLPGYQAILNSGDDGGDFVFFQTVPMPMGDGNPQVLPPSPSDEESERVGRALDAYEQAYASMDMGELIKIWPTLSRKQQRELQDAFEQARVVTVELRQRKFTIGGNNASVVCDQWMRYTSKGTVQPPLTAAVEILLKKNSGGQWLVYEVRSPSIGRSTSTP